METEMRLMKELACELPSVVVGQAFWQYVQGKQLLQ